MICTMLVNSCMLLHKNRLAHDISAPACFLNLHYVGLSDAVIIQFGGCCFAVDSLHVSLVGRALPPMKPPHLWVKGHRPVPQMVVGVK